MAINWRPIVHTLFLRVRHRDGTRSSWVQVDAVQQQLLLICA